LNVSKVVFVMGRMHRIAISQGVFCAFAFLFCWMPPACYSQEPKSAGGLELVSFTAGPNAGLRPGALYFVRANVSNKGTSEETAKLVCKFSENPTEETTFEVRLGAGESRIFELPLLVPKKLETALHIQITLVGMENGREVVLEKEGVPIVANLTADLANESIVTAMGVETAPAERPYWLWPNDSLHESAEMVIGAKVGAGFSRRMIRLEEEGLPDALAWDVVDCFVIADERILANAANQSMLKRWLLGGGRLWVMLDRLPSDAIATLLEVDQSIATIDESSVLGGEVTTNSSRALPKAERTISSSIPLRMKRVVQTGGNVTHLLDNWPLAVWFPVGRGEILATTLSPRAWIQPRFIPPDTPEEKRTAFELKPWALELGSQFFLARTGKPTANSLRDSDYPLRQIGNPVVAKSIVSWSLIGFVTVLCGFGMYQVRKGAAYRLGWMVPLISLLGCLPLVIASQWIRTEIPETWGRLQIIDVSPDGSNADVREVSAVYLNDTNRMELTSKLESRIEPISKQDVGVRRWEWKDLQQWNWRNSDWPAGLWRANDQYSLATQGLMVKGSFNENGILLETPPELNSPLQDPLISFAPGSQLLCSAQEDRLWTAHSSQIAGGERWIAGTLISDEQMRRAEIYRSLFETNLGAEARTKRVLYGFTDLWTNGPSWDRNLVHRGTALVSLPIHLQRPTANTKVHVPYSLMATEALHEEGRRTTAFNQKTGRWKQDSTIAAIARVRYQVPPEVLPLQFSSIAIEILANAPQRKLILSRVNQGVVSEIASVESPSIPWSKTLTAATDMPDPNLGYIDLQIEVTSRLGANAEFEQVVNWGIEYVRVHVDGTVLSNAIDP
jgi:hypothetical protein